MNEIEKYLSQKYKLTNYMKKKILNQLKELIVELGRIPTLKEINLSDKIDCTTNHVKWGFGSKAKLIEELKETEGINEINPSLIKGG